MLWWIEFVDVDAVFGADEFAGWMGTEEGMTEPEAGVAVGLGSGQAVSESFVGRPEPDCEFGMGVVGAVAGAGHV